MEYQKLMELRDELRGLSDAGLCYRLRLLLHPDECPDYGWAPEGMTYGGDEDQDRNGVWGRTVPQRMVTEEEEDERLEEIKEIRGVLVERKDKLIRNAARHYRPAVKRSSSVGEEDLVQVASMGLMEAAERFEDGMNCPFDAYATKVMQYTLFHTYTESSGSVRIPTSSYSYGTKKAKCRKDYSPFWQPRSMDEHFDPDGESSPVENALAAQGRVIRSAENEVITTIETKARAEAFGMISRELNARQLDMLIRHDVDGEDYASIAKDYGVSRQTTRATVRRAEAKLRENEKFREACRLAGIIR